MQHRIQDYTDNDLHAALESPYQSEWNKIQFQAELDSRKFKRQVIMSSCIHIPQEKGAY